MKIFLKIALWSQLLFAMMILLAFVNREEDAVQCRAVNISVDNETTGHYFIESKDIQQLLDKNRIATSGITARNIHPGELESMIRDNPFVENSEVYLTLDGELNIQVIQRNPALRIVNALSESYYIDGNGYLMPVSEIYTAYVPVATGNILPNYSHRQLHGITEKQGDDVYPTILDSLLYLANFIKRDTFLNSLTEQIYVNDEHELELVPRIGKFVILLGDISDLNDKANKLLLLYQKGLNRVGWNQYSSINLKYKGQVVCTRIEVEPVVMLKPMKIKDTINTVPTFNKKHGKIKKHNNINL